MTKVFDGRKFAEEKIEKLDKEVAKLKNGGIHPKLASILVGSDPASMLYVSLKKKRAEGIGAEMDIYYLPEDESLKNILVLIDSLNSDTTVFGIMVQLPLPKNLTNKKDEIINAILPEKDVDGLRNKSPFIHPTAMAVLEVIRNNDKKAKTICVIGKDGMVGSAVLKEIKNTNYKLVEDSKEADILVSATGKAGLVTKDMVKSGAILIDVGSPKGDIDKECFKKASFVTPVPGGIGPITIASLLENLVKASEAIV